MSGFCAPSRKKIKVSGLGKLSFRQEVVRKAMVAFKAGEKFSLESRAAARSDRAVPVRGAARRAAAWSRHRDGRDDEARQKISVVQQRLITEYGYDEHSAKEALSYVTTLLGTGVDAASAMST